MLRRARRSPRTGTFRCSTPPCPSSSSRLLEDGPELKPAYTVTGGAVPDERALSHLVGYPGGTDKVGNWVNQQFQLDAFGEALELLATASSLDRLDTEHWDAVETAVAAIERRWQEPDAGIWELDNQRWAHSRLTCVSGLRAIAKEAPGPQSGRWSGLADAILADARRTACTPTGGGNAPRATRGSMPPC